MKKNFIYLLLLFSLIAQAQVTPSYPTIKLTKTVEGVKQDSLLVIGTDKTVKHIPLSKISSVQEYATASALPITGVAGKLYITKDNNKIYTWNGTFYSEFVGAKGEKGDQGIQGIQGVAGLTGLKGDKGDVGLTGSIGLTGAKGDKGDIGLTGVAGTNGLDGAIGVQGPQGIQGVKGEKGDQGIQGIQGLKGDTGAKGDTGSFSGDITADQVTETATRKFQTPTQSAYNDATSSIQGQLINKVDKVTGKSLLSDTEITRLATLSNYTHPTNHPPSIITQDASNRFVTDAEKTTWNAKEGALGFTPEKVSNKQNSLAVDGENTKYPTVTAVIAGLALKANNSDVVHKTLDETVFGKKTWKETAVFGNGIINAQRLWELPANTFLDYYKNIDQIYGFNIGNGDPDMLFLTQQEGLNRQAMYFGDADSGLNSNYFGLSKSIDNGTTWQNSFSISQNSKVGINNNNARTDLDVLGNIRSSGELTSNTSISIAKIDYQTTNVSPEFLLYVDQGYAFDGTYHYLFGTTRIVKYDWQWNIIAENPDPLSGISGVNHIADGVVVDGFIYLPIESYPSITGMKIAKYNATTLTIVTTYDISAQGHEAGSMATDGTILYIGSYVDGSKIWKYSLTGVYLGFINISTPFTNGIQGIDLYNGDFFVVEQTRLSKLSFDGSKNMFLRALPGDVGNTHRGEGLQVVNGEIRVLIINGALTKVNLYSLNSEVSATKEFNVNSLGEVTATKYIDSNNTPETVLKADGGQSIIFDTPFDVGIGASPSIGSAGTQTLQVIGTTNRGMIQANSNSVITHFQGNETELKGFVGTRSNHPFRFTTNNMDRGGFNAAGDVDFSRSVKISGASGEPLRITRTGGSDWAIGLGGSNDIYFLNKQNSTTPFQLVSGNATFSGTVTASPATLSNHVVVKSQLDAVVARPYKVYTALLNQSGTNAPVATVLENTLGGSITWSRNSVGAYLGTLANGFSSTLSKVRVFISGGEPSQNTTGFYNALPNSIDSVQVNTRNTSGSLADSLMSAGATIEIRVYN